METIERRRMRVLIVEDNDADACLVKTLVEDTGLPTSITLVRDGEGAIRFVESAAKGAAPEPDLILLDIDLPKRNGHEVLASIRENGRTAHICVVMCTGSSSEEDFAQALGNRANAYLIKPMGLEEMDAMVTNLRRILDLIGEGSSLNTSF
jgi:CheY-like chemotaxis protein